jgi:hypothetical protein
VLVGGNPRAVAVYSEYLRHGDRYAVDSNDYCDDALNALSQQRFDLMLLLSMFTRREDVAVAEGTIWRH